MLKYIFSLQFIFFSIILSLSFSTQANFDLHQSIEDFAESFIKEQLILEKNELTTVNVANIDRRVNISACQNNMTATLVGNKNLLRSATVRIKCESATPWQIHVAVKITRQLPVIVSARPLSKGTQLTVNNTKIKYINKALLRSGSITDLTFVQKARLKRQISSGQMVLSRDICLVCKGETVTITSIIGSLTVKTGGVALSNGILNETVKVRNINSKRIVSGTVKSAGMIQISN